MYTGEEEHMPLDLGVLIRVLDEHSKEMKEVTKQFKGIGHRIIDRQSRKVQCLYRHC